MDKIGQNKPKVEDKNCPKPLKNGQNHPKLPQKKLAQISQKSAKIAQNRPKSVKMCQNGSKWVKGQRLGDKGSKLLEWSGQIKGRIIDIMEHFTMITMM